MLGLYLHIPFCSAICNYCNFNRGLFEPALKARYVAGARDGDPPLRARRGRAADTIFFGGGTPSLLDPDEIARLIAACRDTFALADGAEITLETNPETSSAERMERFRAAGVNRISFGVQSFREPELKRLGRIHTADRAIAAIGEARGAGFDNISLDLMMWLPQQSRDDWRESVETLIDVRTRARVAVLARALSECAAERGDGALGLVARAGRRRGGDVLVEPGASGPGRLPAV